MQFLESAKFVVGYRLYVILSPVEFDNDYVQAREVDLCSVYAV